ncbi:LysM peptidoglycan-binding domain-containing protein [Stieleria sp. TO1_6]|uniref:L,D-transpeptidase family protein n=1 Tax=Stieleria tagensis TaxID=2956795 RepID=UPI00209B1C59|nr:L,D-transpeptidase family protein [Stieleria tagensis]MCO8125429.1 LysM peptidoglycan-binding domain-containing protein [Stieleria tagensis]
MQTIKTAAVVVLMLTVLYGGYVSLTTPPEPLPDGIEEFLVIEEAAGGDFASGESLASGLELGQPPAGMMPSTEPATADHPADSDHHHAAAEPTATPPSFGGSFADLPPTTATGQVEQTAATTEPSTLPAVSAPADAASVHPGATADYQSTPGTFNLPDPATAAAHFDPSKGTAFTGGPHEPSNDQPTGTEFQMSDQAGASTALENLGASNDSPPANENRGLINAIASADAMYAKGQLKEALATLSVFYSMPNLSEAQRTQLLSRLDPLAREVIYSKRHLLEQPYRVGGSETLHDIAQKNDVPWQLLANINQVDDPVTVLPGTELKMLRGPFRADVDLTNKQLTLFLGDLYAGRFDIAVGNDPAPKPGTFTVQDKKTSRVYYDHAGEPVPAGSPENPYGNMWLDLGGQICIHGSPNTVQPSPLGCISVAGDYADDVYGILGQGSSVTVRR